MNARVFIAMSSIPLLFAACDTQQPAPQAAPGQVTAAASATDPKAPAAAVEAAPVAEKTHEGCDEKKAEAAASASASEGMGEAKAAAKVETGCEDFAGAQLEHPDLVTVTRPDGKSAQHAGAPFASAEVVAVSALLANPSAFAGKTVKLAGDVSAMCNHKRGWFAVAAEDQTGRFVRVMTAPTFLVPAGSVGKSAETEGVVEVVEVAKDHARHIADEHKLGDPAEIQANVQQVVVRARGAEFF